MHFSEQRPGRSGQRLHGWEHFPIYSRFILISAATAIWRSDLDGCSDFISRRISTILTVRPASGNSGEDGIFPCPAGFWNISIFRLAATEKAKCVPASINLSYFMYRYLAWSQRNLPVLGHLSWMFPDAGRICAVFRKEGGKIKTAVMRIYTLLVVCIGFVFSGQIR